MTAFRTLLGGFAITIVSISAAASAQAQGAASQISASQVAIVAEAPAVQDPTVAATPAAVPVNAPINAMVYDVQPPASGAPLSLRPTGGVKRR